MLHPEFLSWVETDIRSIGISIGCAIGSTALLITGANVQNFAVKAGVFGSVAVIAQSGLEALKTHKLMRQKMSQHTLVAEVHGNKGMGSLMEAFYKPQSTPLLPQSPTGLASLNPSIEYFKWETHDWNDFNRSPNFAIAGATGTGKSTMAKLLCTYLGGFKIAIDPHQAPDTWGGIEKFGVGRDYEAIAKIQNAIVELVSVRYSRRKSDRDVFEPITLIVDEMPAIAMGKYAANHKEFIKLMLTEARKVQVRAFFLTQTDRVEGFGLKGLGDLRDGLQFVRLGEHAINHWRSLRVSDSQPHILSQMDRPAMFGDMPANIPHVADVVLENRSKMPKDLAEILGIVSDERNDSRNVLEALLELDSSDEHEQLETVSNDVDQDAKLARKLREMREQGLNQTEIIWQVWQARPGSSQKYRNSIEEYKRLVEHSGYMS